MNSPQKKVKHSGTTDGKRFSVSSLCSRIRKTVDTYVQFSQNEVVVR